MRTTGRWESWLLAIGGVYLIATPWFFDTTADDASSWNAWIVGAALVLLAILGIYSPETSSIDLIAALGGGWLFLSPWILGFTDVTEAAWNAWIVGAAAVLLALWTVYEIRIEHEHKGAAPIT